MSKKLTTSQVIDKVAKHGHKYLNHYRRMSSRSQRWVVDFECGTCGHTQIGVNLSSLVSPRCRNCKLINHAFVGRYDVGKKRISKK